MYRPRKTVFLIEKPDAADDRQSMVAWAVSESKKTSPHQRGKPARLDQVNK